MVSFCKLEKIGMDHGVAGARAIQAEVGAAVTAHAAHQPRRENENQAQPLSGAVPLPSELTQYNQGAAADAELAENVLKMFLNGVFHDTESPRHLFVGEPLAQKPDDLLLAFGERIRGADPIAVRLCIARVREYEYLTRRRTPPPPGLSPLTLAALDQGRFGAHGRLCVESRLPFFGS